MNEAPSNDESPKIPEMSSDVILATCNDPNERISSRTGSSEDDWTTAAPGSRP